MHIIKRIQIEKFRAFHNLDIPLDRDIIAIAGQNGTQKTTLLGMLAQSVTLTKEPLSNERTIDGEYFKTDIGDKFKFSEKYDNAGDHLWTITLDKDIDEREIFSVRSYPRKECDKPFSLRFWNNDNSRKKGTGFPQCPTIFLSLNRLFPLGEVNNLVDREKTLDDEEFEFYKKWHNQILVIFDNIKSVHSLFGKSVKSSLGPQTDFYDATAISAGQDNIGKIILAVLSFRRLKNKYPNDYKGGIIFIDEIESTLYPAAKKQLLRFMQDMSNELNIQFFFTTHSLAMISYLDSYEIKKSNKAGIVFLKKQGADIIVSKDPTLSGMSKNLSISFVPSISKRKIELFAEDKVSFEFFDALLPNKIVRLISKQKQCTLGFTEYAKLQKQKIHEFMTNVILLDGDAFRGNNKLSDSIIKKYKNWLALPGNSYPEKLLYDFLWDLKEDPNFWDSSLEGYSSQNCFLGYTTQTNDKNIIKSWYQSIPEKERKRFLKKLFNQNDTMKKQFQNDFKKAYNHVAKTRNQEEIEF